MTIPSIESVNNGKVIRRTNYSTVIDGLDGWIYKTTNEEYTKTEFSMLTKMHDSGYVPEAIKLSDTMLAIRHLGEQHESWKSVTDAGAFMSHKQRILDALGAAGVRHGDLTRHAIVVVNNKPMIIDWAQSKLADDQAPDKRSGGDAFWLSCAMREIVDYSTRGTIT